MSAPLVWIVFPGVAAGLLYAGRRWERTIWIGGMVITLALAWLAWQLPIGQPVTLLTWPVLPPFRLSETLVVLGRQFVLDDASRPALVLIYLGMALWIGGALTARTDRLFVPLGLGITALLTAALAVEPFLYAALLIEMAVLFSAPVLSPPGHPAGRGVLRFLTFQTLGMPFLLFTGWLLAGTENSAAIPELAGQVILLIGLGFAFINAIFPFHIWIPMLAEEAHPYAAAFVFLVLPVIVNLFTLGLLEQYAWLRGSPSVYLALRLVGVLMVLTGGVWAAFQRHLGRIMGYGATVEIGLSLLALSLGASAPQLGVFFAQLLPRSLALAIWALALAAIRRHSPGLRFWEVQGLSQHLPVAVTALMLAQFSIAGFPLLAGFPVRLALWSSLAQQSLTVALLTLLGNTGLLVAGLRSLAVLTTGMVEGQWQFKENRGELALLVTGGILLLLIGILPQLFLPHLASLALTFSTIER